MLMLMMIMMLMLADFNDNNDDDYGVYQIYVGNTYFTMLHKTGLALCTYTYIY